MGTEIRTSWWLCYRQIARERLEIDDRVGDEKQGKRSLENERRLAGLPPLDQEALLVVGTQDMDRESKRLRGLVPPGSAGIPGTMGH